MSALRKGMIMKLSAIFLFFVSFNLSAADWVVNKDHSEIFFSIPYLTVSQVTGRFSKFKGGMEVDEKSGLITHLELNISTDSINTENKLRDGHLKAADFLNEKKFPEILFVSTSIEKNSIVHGNLTLHGKSSSQVVNIEISPVQKDSWGYENRFVKFSLSFLRDAFDLKWNKTLSENKYLVGETIKVWGNFQVQPLNSLTPGSKHFIPVTTYSRGREKLKRGEISQADFDRLYAPVQVKAEIKKKYPAPISQTVASSPAPSTEFRNSFNWWVAFGTLGLLGFFAAIILGLYAKNLILDVFPKKYKEAGPIGHLSDLMVIGFVLIYSMAFWYVGWGS
jgi:polyisoprenoid-binding protein YceI